MPFRLENAGASFHKVLDDVLANHPNTICYIDDVLIYTITLEQHLAHIRQAFNSIAVLGLKTHPTNCVFSA